MMTSKPSSTGIFFAAPRNPTALILGELPSEVDVALSNVGARVKRFAPDPDSRAWIEQLKREQVDLVVLDASSNALLELARTLKADPLTNLIGAIAIGGGQPARLSAVRVGCDHWMENGSDRDELSSRAIHLLR